MSTVYGVLAVVALGVSSQSGLPLAEQTRLGQEGYALLETSPLLSTDESLLLSRIDDEVPADATVAGSPSTGTSLVYALSGRRALLPHIFGERDERTELLVQSLRDADSDPDVCPAAEALGVSHVLDFGDVDVDGIDRVYPGFEDLAWSDAVELVDREGSARLYELTACR